MKSVTMYRLRHKASQQWMVVCGTWEHPEGQEGRLTQFRLNHRGDGEIWEVPDETTARMAQHRWVPEDWKVATYERPINGYFHMELEVVRVTTVEEVV